MDVLCEMKRIFNVDTLDVSERSTVLEISFNVTQDTLPNEETFSTVFSLIPTRDVMQITLLIDTGDTVIIRSDSAFPSEAFAMAIEDIDEETVIRLVIDRRTDRELCAYVGDVGDLKLEGHVGRGHLRLLQSPELLIHHI